MEVESEIIELFNLFNKYSSIKFSIIYNSFLNKYKIHFNELYQHSLDRCSLIYEIRQKLDGLVLFENPDTAIFSHYYSDEKTTDPEYKEVVLFKRE